MSRESSLRRARLRLWFRLPTSVHQATLKLQHRCAVGCKTAIKKAYTRNPICFHQLSLDALFYRVNEMKRPFRYATNKANVLIHSRDRRTVFLSS